MAKKQLEASIPKDRDRKSRPQPKPEPEVRERNSGAHSADASTGYARAMQKAFGKRVDAVDKKLGLNFALTKQPRISTGLKSVDLMLGNGLVPGFSVFVGQEQSAKSTACMTTLRSSLRYNVPVRKYFDAEGAIDRRYTGNILGTDSFTSVFGDRDRMGKWIVPPECLYHDNNIIETVFRDMHRTASFMPDKVYREDLKTWFLVFDRDRDSVALCKELVASGAIESPDKTLYKSTARYWCSIGDDDSPQAVFFVDSFPAMIPEKIDEEEMSDNGLAIEARFLGKYMKLLRGKLRPKGIILLGVNQMRDRPMAGPGQLPYYETGGNALKFASDSRSMWTSRVPMDNFPRFKDNKGLCVEESVEFEGGIDLYAFKGVTNIKNKLGQPFRKSAARVWIKDGEGEPRGFDPVYDIWRFFDTLGVVEDFQPLTVTDSRKKFHINLKPVDDVNWTWPMFKSMIIGQYDKDRRLMKIAQDLGAPVRFDLIGYCKKLLDSGRTEDMLAAHLRKEESESPKGGVDIEAEDKEADDA